MNEPLVALIVCATLLALAWRDRVLTRWVAVAERRVALLVERAAPAVEGPKAREPMPVWLAAAINAESAPFARSDMQKKAEELYAASGDWSRVGDELFAEGGV